MYANAELNVQAVDVVNSVTTVFRRLRMFVTLAPNDVCVDRVEVWEPFRIGLPSWAFTGPSPAAAPVIVDVLRYDVTPYRYWAYTATIAPVDGAC